VPYLVCVVYRYVPSVNMHMHLNLSAKWQGCLMGGYWEVKEVVQLQMADPEFNLMAGGVAQAVECLLCKHKAFSSNPNLTRIQPGVFLATKLLNLLMLYCSTQPWDFYRDAHLISYVGHFLLFCSIMLGLGSDPVTLITKGKALLLNKPEKK
jgi:hypothetical protein